jgi:hypothetical protein
MKKETIGKVQLWIGIILLIVGIAGLVWSLETFKEVNRSMNNPDFSKGETDEETYMSFNLWTSVLSLKYDLLLTKFSTSIITIFISILFITQGLANKGEGSK